MNRRPRNRQPRNRQPVNRALALLLLTPLGLGLAACGGSSDEDAQSAPTLPASTASAPTSTASAPASSDASATATATATATPFNPCDGLDAAAISKALGSAVKVETGTASEPRCALLPKKKGGPTFDLSYLWFDGGLDAAWDSITDKPAGTLTQPAIKGADATRLVVQRKPNGYAVSAFLQNGTLIQSLNGIALPPYDAAAMQRATTTILTQLSAAAAAR